MLPLIRVLRECSGRGQEGAARALEKLASHKDAATTIIKEGELSAFLSSLDSGNEQTQLHGVRTLFLLRGVDSVVNSEIVTTGGFDYSCVDDTACPQKWHATASDCDPPPNTGLTDSIDSDAELWTKQSLTYCTLYCELDEAALAEWTSRFWCHELQNLGKLH